MSKIDRSHHHHNEGRQRALGLTVWRAKATGFALSGALAGLAGCLAAQHAQHVSPGLLSWTVSGEALVVVILGGLGTLVGVVVGAILSIWRPISMPGLMPSATAR